MSDTKTATYSAIGGTTYASGAGSVDVTCRGVHCNGDGVLTATFIDDSACVANLKDGMYYPYQLSNIASFTGDNVIALK